MVAGSEETPMGALASPSTSITEAMEQTPSISGATWESVVGRKRSGTTSRDPRKVAKQSEEDMLPKTVCQMCTSKLDSIHEFATMAAQTQEKLVKMGSTTESEEVGGSGSGESDGSEERWDDSRHQASTPPPEEESQDQLKGSLLHSILTKEKEEDTGGDVTEMEVRVDPMLYLTDLDEEEGDKGAPGVQAISGLSHSATLTTHHPHEEDYGEGQSLDCKPYQCSICPRGFNTDLSLKNHLWSHISMRKILASSDLNLNRFRVEGASQCLCTVCGRVYPTRSTLRAHQITHSNLRPHKCSLCEKTFKRNQDLKFHINQHTGERPYRCPYCPKAFASSGNCFSHRKRMHPKQLARDKKARQLHH